MFFTKHKLKDDGPTYILKHSYSDQVKDLVNTWVECTDRQPAGSELMFIMKLAKELYFNDEGKSVKGNYTTHPGPL